MIQTANILATLLYALASLLLFIRLWQQQPLHKGAVLGFTLAILVVHGLGVYGLSITPDGFQLGFFAASSLIFWVINLLVLLSSLKKALHNLFILLFPLSALSVLSSLLGHTTRPETLLGYPLASHVILSILAYSLLTIATLQALLLAYQHHQLKHRHSVGVVRVLPPLQTMESLLFELLWAGFALLTLAIASGFYFLDDLFAQHLAHKTVFALAAWVIYALLLWGRHQLGWRGYTAVRWTLGGFALLMLAYFGSKLVLELILGRL
jgi:ABC-type uncharacterized transport system permease subunit